MDAQSIDKQKILAFDCWELYTEKQIELAKIQYANLAEEIFDEVEKSISDTDLGKNIHHPVKLRNEPQETEA